MDVITEKMAEYANFLDENSRNIETLCNMIEQQLQVAVQCMDQQSGRNAALRMAQNIENVKNNRPISDNASERLVLAKKLVEGAVNIL